MNYRKATLQDLNLLVNERLNFIDINPSSTNFYELKKNCITYFENALKANLCDIILAEDNDKCIGTGIIFYYSSVPSTLNPTGQNAYITNMYVQPNYRRQGIASTILSMLIQEARTKHYSIIMLNASDVGYPLYKKFGFSDIHNGMIYKCIK